MHFIVGDIETHLQEFVNKQKWSNFKICNFWNWKYLENLVRKFSIDYWIKA